MRQVFLLLMPMLVMAQSDSTPTPVQLLQQVADTIRQSPRWHIEGSLESPGTPAAAPEHFKLWVLGPNQIRFEQDGPSSPALILCNGPDAVVYSPPLKRYRLQSTAADQSGNLCSPILGDWMQLPGQLAAPTLVGSCGPDPDIAAPGHSLVRGFEDPQLPSAGRITRSLCIDTTRHLIVWDHWQTKFSTRLYRYALLDPDPTPPPDLLQFTPPPGSTPTDFELPTPRPLGSREISASPDITQPQVLSHTTPHYPESMREPKGNAGAAGSGAINGAISGTVKLYLVIGTNGKPGEVLVYRPLHPTLDAEAIKAIKKWKFTPPQRNGTPTPLPFLLEVNFKLL